MEDEAVKQLIAELAVAQEHALRAFASAVADTYGDHDRLAQACDYHSARLQHAECHPIAELWLEAVSLDLRSRAAG